MLRCSSRECHNEEKCHAAYHDGTCKIVWECKILFYRIGMKWRVLSFRVTTFSHRRFLTRNGKKCSYRSRQWASCEILVSGDSEGQSSDIWTWLVEKEWMSLLLLGMASLRSKSHKWREPNEQNYELLEMSTTMSLDYISSKRRMLPWIVHCMTQILVQCKNFILWEYLSE